MKKFLAALSLILVGAASVIFGACQSDEIQLTFNDGGNVNVVKVEKGSEYELPSPEKEGYEFDGWYVSEDLSGDAVSSVTVAESVTYYAKWSKLYTVRFNTDGGSLAQNYLTLKEGANLYDAVKDVVPVKTDYQFDAWLNGTALVTPNTVMSGDVTLTARYKVKYVVEVYRETLDGTAYRKDAEDVVGYGYVGAKTVPELSSELTTGFAPVSNESEVVELTLSATATENVFKYYYDRETYAVSFRTNYPNGESTEIKSVEVKYGTKVVLPNDITYEGYCLAGWATSSSGEPEYRVDSVADKLYGGTGAAETVEFTPDRDTGLYAVWTKGCTDMFGGDDIVYLFDENGTDIYLSRGDVFFKGEYFGTNGEFSFREGRNAVHGRIYPDGTFSYYNADNDMKPLSLYRYGEGIVDGTTVILDGYNGITYRAVGVNSKGTYVFDEQGLAVATFTEGNFAGQTFTLMLATITIGGTTNNVFLIKDAEKYGEGMLSCATIGDRGELTYYTNNYKAMAFTSFGNAYCNDNSMSPTSYFCEFKGDEVLLKKASSKAAPTPAKIITINGVKCYLMYDAKSDFTATNGNDSLVLDGYGNATYTENGVKTVGRYRAGNSGFADYAVTFYANGSAQKLFLVSGREVASGDGSETTVVYSYTVKPVDYAEYNYADETTVYSKVYIVLNDELPANGVKSAAIYIEEESGFTKISSGTYAEASGLYVYTVKTFELPAGVTSPFATDNPTEFVFSIGTASMMGFSFPAIYCVEYTDGVTSGSAATVYTSDKGETLSLAKYGSLGTVAVYKVSDDEAYVGTYSESNNIVTVTLTEGTLCFGIDKTNKTFESLMYAPYRIYGLNEKFQTNRNVYIAFDGKGKIESRNATYNVVEGDVTTTTAGTVSQNSDGTYTFTATDGSLTVTYTLYSTQTSSAFKVYDAAYAGRYVSPEGTLELDGYGSASLSTTDGSLSGMYSVMSENVIRITTENAYVYVDLTVNAQGTATNRGSFTIRGQEYGQYFIYDNNILEEIVLEFDGYGKLKAYTMVKSGDDYVPEYIDENGTYEITGEVVTVHYDNKNIAGVLAYLSANGNAIPLFVIINDEVAHTYVSTSDWAVLILDGTGRAVKYSGVDGTKETGTYTIITESLLYYYNDKGTDACVYVYDNQTLTATAYNYTARGYYTETLESLMFTKYGFAVFNGETRYYYYIEDDGNVSIYRRPNEDETGVTPNKYGFIKESFGTFEDTKVYEGKTYSLSDGFAISFNRQADTADKYPVPVSSKVDGVDVTNHYPLGTLSFTPAGSTEFNVSGSILINDLAYKCNIVRKTVNEKLETYIAIYTSGSNYFRFDIDIRYGGVGEDGTSNSYYSVKSMSMVMERASYVYMYNYYMYSYIASLLGQSNVNLENKLGEIVLITDYNEEGVAGESYLNATFGADTGLYDVNGEMINLSHVPYTYDEKTQLYTVELAHTDGYTYRIRFATEYLRQFSTYGYILESAVRVQTFTDNGYTAEIEVLVASDMFNAKGEVYSVKLKQGETEIAFSTGITFEGGVYYVSRTTDETSGKITATDYYKITYTKADPVEGNLSVPVLTAATVTKLGDVKTVYAEDGKSYADIDVTENKVLYFYVYNADTKKGTGYSAKTCEYSTETGEYTVKLASGRVFTVKVIAATDGGDDTVVITEVVEATEEGASE